MAFVSTTFKTSSSTGVKATGATTPMPQPPYLYYNSFETTTVDWPVRPIGQTFQGQLESYNDGSWYWNTNQSGLPSNSSAYAVAGTQSLHIPANNQFPQLENYNDTNTPVFCSQESGFFDFYFLYVGSWTSGAMICRSGGKTTVNNGPLDTDDAIQIKTGSTAGVITVQWTQHGGVSQTFTYTPPSAWTAGVWHHIRCYWNYSATKKVVFQDDFLPPLVILTTLNPWKCNVLHDILIGNDVGTTFEFYIDEFYMYRRAPFDLPVTVWQDFEFSTVDQASLEANDHNPSLTWNLTGTTSRFTTQTAGQQTMPSTLNFQTDSGTRGLRYDINATASGHIGVTFTNTTQGLAYGFWFKSANLASGTTNQFAFNSESTVNHDVLNLKQTNVAGQQKIQFVGQTTATIDISADTWYWVSVWAIRGGALDTGTFSTLRVYTTTGSLVGTAQVHAGNFSIGSVRLGSQASTTSQAAGTYFYFDNLVYDQYATTDYALKPWV